MKMYFSYLITSNGEMSLPVACDLTSEYVYVSLYDLLVEAFQIDRYKCEEFWMKFTRESSCPDLLEHVRTLVYKTLDGRLVRSFWMRVDAVREIGIKHNSASIDLLSRIMRNPGDCRCPLRDKLGIPLNSKGVVITPNGLYVERILVFDQSTLWDDWAEDSDDSECGEVGDPYDESMMIRVAGGDVWLTLNELSRLIDKEPSKIEKELAVYDQRGIRNLPVVACARYIKDDSESIVYGLSATMSLITAASSSKAVCFRRWVRRGARFIGSKAHVMDWKYEGEFEDELLKCFDNMSCLQFCKDIDRLGDKYLKSFVFLWPAVDPDRKYFEARLTEALCRFELENRRSYDAKSIFCSRYLGIRFNSSVRETISSYERAISNGSGYAAYRLSLFYKFLETHCNNDFLKTGFVVLDPAMKKKYETLSSKYFFDAVKIHEPHAILHKGIELENENPMEAIRLIACSAETGLKEAMLEYAKVLEREGSQKCRVWYNMVIERELNRRYRSLACAQWLERLAYREMEQEEAQVEDGVHVEEMENLDCEDLP